MINTHKSGVALALAACFTVATPAFAKTSGGLSDESGATLSDVVVALKTRFGAN